MKVSRLFLMILLIFVLLICIFGSPIFLAAGTLRFLNGWLFLGIFSLCSILISAINPELTEKRIKGTEDEKTQTIVKILLTLCALAILIISGLDFRYKWSNIQIPIVIVFSLIMICGFIILSIVMKENSFATRVVEIQKDQKIIDTGTYSIVRHPMYLAFTIIFISSSIVLGSLYSIIPAMVIPFLLTFRINNEEQLLRKGLIGYESYMKKVKYKLIPFIW
jgi:protein-S-isoprenylcysteine O-methyltransferase Ste14